MGMKRKYRYLTLGDREKIAEWCNSGMRPANIAEKLGFSTAAIYRELKNGFAGEVDGRKIYDPVLAERNTREKIKNRGNPLPRKGKIAEEQAVCIVKTEPTGEIKVIFSGAAPMSKTERMRIVTESIAEGIAKNMAAGAVGIEK
jgi:IS30 family transposase